MEIVYNNHNLKKSLDKLRSIMEKTEEKKKKTWRKTMRLSDLNNGENKDNWGKKINRASGSHGTIPKDLTFVSIESQGKTKRHGEFFEKNNG